MHMSCQKRCFVTGGGGYVGAKLCTRLSELGYSVTAFDVHYLENNDEDSIRRIQGDIRNRDSVLSALSTSQADVVFHVASYGMSGRDMLNKKQIEEVNVQGTKNIIEACVEIGVSRIVYTSTYNVVFGGQEIRNGDTSLPYLPLDKHVDHYSRTKCIAEQEVMRANGRVMKGEGRESSLAGGRRKCLKTCALRCAGIYGKGEQRHLPRIVSYIERGLFQFTYGDPKSLVEFLHADNFVQAHNKAAEAMEDNDSPVIGQAYFISDGTPINNFEFFRPLVEGLGHTYPTIRLPISLIYFFAFMTEIIHSFWGRYIYNFQPLLTRAEVFKTGVTHYFNMDKARQDFGYDPEPRNLKDAVEYFKEKGHGRRNSVSSSSPKLVRKKRNCLWSLFRNLILALVIFALIMSLIPTIY